MVRCRIIRICLAILLVAGMATTHAEEVELTPNGDVRLVDEVVTKKEATAALVEMAVKEAVAETEARHASHLEELKAELLAMEDEHEASTMMVKSSVQAALVEAQAEHASQMQQLKVDLEESAIAAEKQASAAMVESAVKAAMDRAETEYTSQIQSLNIEHEALLTDYKEALVKIDDFEKALSHLEEESDRDINDLQNQVKELSEKLEVQNKLIEMDSEKLDVTTRELMDTHDELKRMHDHATSKYVNFTLIREDSNLFIEEKKTKTLNFLQVTRDWIVTNYKAFVVWITPHLKFAAAKSIEFYETVRDKSIVLYGKFIKWATPHWLKMTRQLNALYGKHMAPSVEKVIGNITSHQFYIKQVVPFTKRVAAFIEVARIQIISWIEDGSKFVLEKVEAKWPKGKMDEEAPFILNAVVKAMKYCHSNAAHMVHMVWMCMRWYAILSITYLFLLGPMVFRSRPLPSDPMTKKENHQTGGTKNENHQKRGLLYKKKKRNMPQ